MGHTAVTVSAQFRHAGWSGRRDIPSLLQFVVWGVTFRCSYWCCRCAFIIASDDAAALRRREPLRVAWSGRVRVRFHVHLRSFCATCRSFKVTVVMRNAVDTSTGGTCKCRSQAHASVCQDTHADAVDIERVHTVNVEPSKCCIRTIPDWFRFETGSTPAV